MHEVGIMAEALDVVLRHAGTARVRRVRMRVGVMAGVLEDALRFAFGALSAGTVAEDAVLEVEEVDGAGIDVKSLEVDRV